MSNGTDSPLWDRTPPKGTGRYVPIVRAPERGALPLVVVGQDVVGIWVHWSGQHLLPCMGDPNGCRHCREKHGRKWMGYLAVWLEETDRVAILEIPSTAARECPHLERGVLPDLRGWRIVVDRHKPGKRGRIRVQFVRDCLQELPIPPIFDVKPHLMRLWDGGERRETRKEEPSGGN